MEPAVFDTYSISYDADFTETAVGKAQRNRVCKLLSEVLPKNESIDILEVNCGTGADAVWLANQGHRVLATDVSSEMIAISKQKSLENSLNLQFQIAGFQDIGSISKPNSFDLIFSNFGGLNCISENDLQKFLATAHQLLKPGGSLVMVIMPRFCIWETGYYLLKFQPNTAFRRWRSKAIVNLWGSEFWVYYHNPSRVLDLGKEIFKLKKQASVGLFLPPSYLSGFFKNKPGLLKFLNRLEILFAEIPLFTAFSDHYFLHLKKR